MNSVSEEEWIVRMRPKDVFDISGFDAIGRPLNEVMLMFVFVIRF